MEKQGLEKQGSERQDRLRVSSPLKGWCATLDDSPDPVFRDRILGEGVSIDPTVGEIHAPFDGEVLMCLTAGMQSIFALQTGQSF